MPIRDAKSPGPATPPLLAGRLIPTTTLTLGAGRTSHLTRRRETSDRPVHLIPQTAEPNEKGPSFRVGVR